MTSCRAYLRLLLGAIHLLIAFGFLSLNRPSVCQEYPLLFEDRFEASSDNWTFSDAALDHPTVWAFASAGDSAPGGWLRVNGKSAFQPPHRSPHSIALLNPVQVSSFQMDVRLQSTRPDAGPHRDLCLFWGYQDPAHYYYVHLGAQADPHACQIFIVNGAARKAITVDAAAGTPWTDGWHHVRVRFDSASGQMDVYFDDLSKPFMTARDRTFLHGHVGLGTFDDHGNFDDFRLRGIKHQAQ